ncbi:MAG: MFS transporter [Desulfobacterales bacterium]|jgi:UMF1 family MFS transporter|nr:MFS transporter [Desulfobacterales bacterium]
MLSNKKAIYGWAIYDWANSAFATTVMAGFFPLFFKQFWSAGVDVNLSTARLGLGNALAGLLVAFLAPVLGAAADEGGARKKFLIAFAYLGVLMTAALAMIQKGQWQWAVVVYAIGSVGFSGANVFYDSLLPRIAEEKDWARVSSLGYALGYIGGGLLFLLNVVITQHPSWFGLSSTIIAVRLSFVSVALWWGGFTVFTLCWVPEVRHADAASTRRMVFEGFRQLAKTFREIRQLKPIWLFLLAYWCYIDGVDTIVKMAVDYGLSLGFGASDLILALLLVQFIGFPAALAFGRLGAGWGERKAIFLVIGMYMVITLWGVFMKHRVDFYILAALVGLAQGGIQALSRSYYARMIPIEKSAQYFGFYNMLGKFAAIIGPALVGGAGLLARYLLMPDAPSETQLLAVSRMAARWSLSSILILFFLGAGLFYFAGRQKPLTGR